MIVVDTNIIAYLYLEGQHTKQVEKLLEKDSLWIAPLLWRSEFRNILAFYLRKKIIGYIEANDIIEQAETLMDGNEYSVTSKHVLELIKESDCSAYDCEFVCLAQEMGVSLVTEDKKILKNFPDYTLSLGAFGASPS